MQVALALYAASIINTLLGALVLARAYRKPYSWFFLVAILGTVFWAVGDALLLTTKSQTVLEFAKILFYIGPMLIPVFMWFFALSFPERKIDKRALAGGGGLLLLAIIIIIALPQGLIKDVIISSTGNNTPIINLTGFVLYATYFSSMFTVTYFTLIRLYSRQKTPVLRSQVLYVLLGLMLASIPALYTNLGLPLLGNSTAIWLGPLFTSIFVLSVTVSIVKHRLFDIQLIIARSIGYLLSLASIALVFGVLVISAVDAVFFADSSMSTGQKITYSFIATVIAILYVPLKRFFDRLTNRLFFQDSYEPQSFIDSLNRALITNVSVEALLNDATKVIDDNLKSGYSCVHVVDTSQAQNRNIGTQTVLLSDTELETLHHATKSLHSKVLVAEDLIESQPKVRTVMAQHGIAVAVRLGARNKGKTEEFGFLYLGGKRTGNSYSSRDINIIRIIANELTIAMQNAIRFEEIENFNITLKTQITEATKKLRRSNDKLKALDVAKDDFVSMASHQLRTPLTSIKGYVSMVLEGDAGPINDMQRKLLEQSFVSSQRMVFLIADLLNVSRLKTGKFVIEEMPVNLAEVVDSEIDQLKSAAASRQLTLSFDPPKTFPTLMLDDNKTRQVIMNFTDNAIYYTPSGGAITVRLVETEHSVEFRVEDNGIGVPRSERPHLFTKFYRAGNARKARPDGTGLGLFMAKKVIVSQGGSVIFESEEGKGSTFGFSFPKTKMVPGTTEAAK